VKKAELWSRRYGVSYLLILPSGRGERGLVKHLKPRDAATKVIIVRTSAGLNEIARVTPLCSFVHSSLFTGLSFSSVDRCEKHYIQEILMMPVCTVLYDTT